MSPSFSDLGLPGAAVDALASRGLTEAFPIQAQAIPPALDGRDVCGKAPTGAGKTLAFGLPLAERVGKAKPRRPRALVLAPTRELAAQIHDELRALLPRDRTVHAFYGGVGFGPQVSALRRGVDVVVACPGRLADLIGSGEVRLDDVEIAVIDEADRMADMGFLPEVRRLLDQVRADRQTLLFSATLDGDVDVLVRRYQHDPVRCEVEPDERHGEQTTHHLVRVERQDRVATTAALVDRHGPTVVFCRTKHGTDRVAKQLGRAGVEAVPIHGGRSQAQRTRALAAFTAGRAQALVATDVAARGIHVDDVACVVHFDVAGDHKDYVHRSGRTGRAGAEGAVFTLITEADGAKLRDLRRGLEVELVEAELAGLAVARRSPTAGGSGGGRDGARQAGGAGRGGGDRRDGGDRRQGSSTRSGGRNRSSGGGGQRRDERSRDDLSADDRDGNGNGDGRRRRGGRGRPSGGAGRGGAPSSGSSSNGSRSSKGRPSSGGRGTSSSSSSSSSAGGGRGGSRRQGGGERPARGGAGGGRGRSGAGRRSGGRRSSAR